MRFYATPSRCSSRFQLCGVHFDRFISALRISISRRAAQCWCVFFWNFACVAVVSNWWARRARRRWHSSRFCLRGVHSALWPTSRSTFPENFAGSNSRPRTKTRRRISTRKSSAGHPRTRPSVQTISTRSSSFRDATPRQHARLTRADLDGSSSALESLRCRGERRRHRRKSYAAWRQSFGAAL